MMERQIYTTIARVTTVPNLAALSPRIRLALLADWIYTPMPGMIRLTELILSD
jgi:hypothetical protein